MRKLQGQDPEASDEYGNLPTRPCPGCNGYLGFVMRGLDAIHRFELATPNEGIGVGLRVFLLF